MLSECLVVAIAYLLEIPHRIGTLARPTSFHASPKSSIFDDLFNVISSGKVGDSNGKSVHYALQYEERPQLLLGK